MEIKIQGLQELITKLDANALLGPPLRIAFQRSALMLESMAKQITPVDTGRLRSSITHSIDSRPVPLWGQTGTKTYYAPFVEFGTKPHWPPLSAMQPWARRHGFPEGQTGAFLVARAIATRGTIKRFGYKGAGMFKGALEAGGGKVQSMFDRAAREIEELWGR